MHIIPSSIKRWRDGSAGRRFPSLMKNQSQMRSGNRTLIHSLLNDDEILKRRQQAQQHSPGQRVEVAPPGWGHTKAEYEKTKPNKPKSKIGGTCS